MGSRKLDAFKSYKMFQGAFGQMPTDPSAVRDRGGDPQRGSRYSKLKMGIIRYHKKSSGTAIAQLGFFNAAKTANVCNNEVAGKLGDWKKIITELFFLVMGADAVALTTDVWKVVNNAEIDLTVGGVKYLDRCPMIPYLAALGPSSWDVHSTSDPVRMTSDGWDIPNIDVAYEPSEGIELTLILNTAPTNAIQIMACLAGPEWVRGSRA